MLAYVSWHRPRAGAERAAYERALERFHRSLAHRPPSGFHGSAGARLATIPWLEGGAGYEDWYLLEDWTALGVLEMAAVSQGHLGAHDAVAKLAGTEVAAVYRLLEGSAHPGEAAVAAWVTTTPGYQPELAALLGDGIDPRRASLWRRALVLGPAPQYCLLAPEPPAGIASTRLPEGWHAHSAPREPLYSGPYS
ncbi:MAG: hypothetical protein ACRDK2_07475 [Solirubrobacteraceae bacterium]